MKRLLFFVCFLLAMGCSNSLFFEAYATTLKGMQTIQREALQKNKQQKKIIKQKNVPPRHNVKTKQTNEKTSVSTKPILNKSQKNSSQPSLKADYLQITETGSFVSPLHHQSIAQDGSSGLAYQKKQVIPEKTDENVLNGTQQETRRLKAVEREYSFSGSTFGADTRNQIKVPANASFKMPTMQEAEKEVKKENIRFEECQEGDKNCAEYKVDETGKVIW